jgi:hypothetical protein
MTSMISMTWHGFWKPVVAGACGSAAHSLLMYAKSRAGVLPAFQPYEALQTALSYWLGADIHPLVPFALSFVNGSTLVGFVFGQVYEKLPGSGGATKGLFYGIAGWLTMNLLFFPLLGLGVFAATVGLGALPALFALAMLLTYSVVMGMVYAALGRVS